MKPRSLAFSFLILVSTLTGRAMDAKPDVVIFISDDMGWNDVGYHGSVVETPNLDRLAEEGMRLDRFYVHPICSPTRAGLFTGRLPARFGISGPLSNSPDRGLPVDEILLSNVFQEAGYETALIGKWHLGSGPNFHPNTRGFDHFYGHLSGMIDYFAHTNNGAVDWQRNGESLEEDGYTTDLIAEEAVRWVEGKSSRRPMLLLVPFNAPHGPPQAPAELVEKYEEKGLSGQSAIRSASIDSMDQAIGEVLEAVDVARNRENTLVLFFCDNGNKGARGRESSESGNLSLRGGKGELYEGGIRVPAVMRWPRHFAAGSHSEAFFSVLDLFPTLLEAIPLSHKPANRFDGVSRWSQLKGSASNPAEPIVVLGQRGSAAVIDPPLKLIKSGSDLELFDIVSDPTESHELSEEQPDDASRLLSLLEPYSELGRRGKKGGGKEKKGKGKKRS